MLVWWCLDTNPPYQKCSQSDPPFVDLYQSIEEAALRRSEKTKPLPCPNFPKLPQKRTRHKSGGNSAAAVATPAAKTTLSLNNPGNRNVKTL